LTGGGVFFTNEQGELKTEQTAEGMTKATTAATICVPTVLVVAMDPKIDPKIDPKMDPNAADRVDEEMFAITRSVVGTFRQYQR
jgi:hypothetical protein